MRSDAYPPVAFILGVGRCGSTLVHEIVARHPDVGFVSNVDDRLAALGPRGRWNGPLYRRTPPELTRKGRMRFAPSEGYRVLGRQVSPMLVAPARDLIAADASPWLALRLRSFFDERASAQGRRLFLHKFTGWPRAGLLHRVFPEARFVHVVRDGRAVASSLVQMPWWPGYGGPEAWTFGPLPEAYGELWERSHRSFAVLAGLQWRLLMDAFDEARRQIPSELWLDVRYEDFVAEPRDRMQQVLGHLGLSWTHGFEQGFRSYRFDVSRTDAYRGTLGRHELQMLERVLGPTLARWGYVEGRDGKAEGAYPRKREWIDS